LLDNTTTLLNDRKFVILTIDIQNDYCSSKSPATVGTDYDFKREAARRLTKLLEVTRMAKIPVIHVKTQHSEWTDNPVWTTRRANPGVVVREGTWGEGWWDEFKENWPIAGEYVVTKHRWSAFHATELDLVLRCKKFETIILTGVSSAGCVDATARDGFMLGYGVIVLSDCTWAKTRESHETSLKKLNHHHGIVVTSDEILKVLSPQLSM
jgi:ureidoacrylate peracid hydrolase